MSDVMKLNLGSKKLKARLPNDNDELGSFREFNDKEDAFKKTVNETYDNGFNAGYIAAKEELESQFTTELVSKSEEFYNILSEFEQRLNDFSDSFGKIVVEVSRQISEKIINREVEKFSIIESTINEALKKVIGANEVLIKINPADSVLLENSGTLSVYERNFSKIKFELVQGIRKGGCFIETDIGNVEARINSQLSEIIKQMELSLQTSDEQT